MATAFCSNCGTPTDASGACPRGCAVASPQAEYAPGSGRFAGSAPATAAGPVYAAAKLTKYSGMWNWGAFFLCPFWLMNHGALWLGIVYLVLSFVPFLGIAALGMAIYFGIKGNDWAVQHRNFVDEQQFVAVQNAWRNVGAVLFVLGIVLGIVGSIAAGIFSALTRTH